MSGLDRAARRLQILRDARATPGVETSDEGRTRVEVARMTTTTFPDSGQTIHGSAERTASAEDARLVNERFRARRPAAHADSVWVVLCECGRRGCRSGIELSIAEYDAIRQHADWHIVLVGHEDSSDDAVGSTERYLLVTLQSAAAGWRRAGSRGLT
jgi:hypothetical protein